MIELRQATEVDFSQIWLIFHEIITVGASYAIERDTDEVGAKYIWMETPQETWVAVEGDEILGTYYIKPNKAGGGAHVCNCGYMVKSSAQGRGIASSMCEQSQVRAVELGFRAMQFNFVLASNTKAIGLWLKFGFEQVGRLPEAFEHPTEGFVDALIMFKNLT